MTDLICPPILVCLCVRVISGVSVERVQDVTEELAEHISNVRISEEALSAPGQTPANTPHAIGRMLPARSHIILSSLFCSVLYLHVFFCVQSPVLWMWMSMPNSMRCWPT